MKCENCSNLENKIYGKYCSYNKKMFFNGFQLKKTEESCDYGGGFMVEKKGFFGKIISSFAEKIVGVIG